MRIHSSHVFCRTLIGSAAVVALACAAPALMAEGLAGKSVESSTHAAGVPGGIKQRVSTLEAEVTAIDLQKRQVTLQDAVGNRETLTIPPEAINFDQVKKGDRVSVRFAEELVVYLKDRGAPAGSPSAAGFVARAPEGEKPALVAADSLEFTAVVTAIDLEQHRATLTLPDGQSRVVQVRDDVVLSPDQVGREVVFRQTEAMALSVDSVKR